MIELLDISIFNKFEDRRKLGRKSRTNKMTSLMRQKRRHEQNIFYLDKKLIDGNGFGKFIATKNLFNEGYDYILKVKGLEKADKYIQERKNRPWNN